VHPVEKFAEALAQAWREEGVQLGRRGLVEPSNLLASVADELLEKATEWLDTPLDLAEAAEICGLSYERLQHMVSGGGLPNAGVRGRPRIRRRDLPMKVVGGSIRGQEIEDAGRPGTDPVLDLIEAEIIAMEVDG
jgi:hypothetical protein